MTVKLPEEIKIYNVGEVWTELSGIIEKSEKSSDKKNVIDACELTDIDGAGLQLLFMLFRIQTEDAGFRLEGLKEEIAEKLSKYGFYPSGEKSLE